MEHDIPRYSDNYQLNNERVKEACRVLLEHMQSCGAETFHFATDYTTSTHEQGRLVVYAAKGQPAHKLENVLKCTNPEEQIRD